MFLPEPDTTPDRRLLRGLAGAAGALILVAWFWSLASEPGLLRANVFRVLGSVVAAGIAWTTHPQSYGRRREGLPWQRCLAAGVLGALAVTGISLLAPGLGRFSLPGWLASGVAGGAIVILTGFALTGPRRLPRRSYRPDPESRFQAPQGQ
jgi:hypothetical protein